MGDWVNKDRLTIVPAGELAKRLPANVKVHVRKKRDFDGRYFVAAVQIGALALTGEPRLSQTSAQSDALALLRQNGIEV